MPLEAAPTLPHKGIRYDSIEDTVTDTITTTATTTATATATTTTVPTSTATFTATATGHADGIIRLCSFNAHKKFEPTSFAAWMNVLMSNPRTVLVLLAPNPHVKDNLIMQMKYHVRHERCHSSYYSVSSSYSISCSFSSTFQFVLNITNF